MSASPSGPQWIVENREDGTNVHNWHWVEKECLGWFRERLRSSLLGKPLFENCAVGTCASDVEVTGEATANNRRGKTIFLYELEITVHWTFGEKSVTGTVAFPYVGEDNEGEKYEAKVKCTNKDSTTTSAVESVREKGVPVLSSAIVECIAAMKSKFTGPSSAAPSATKVSVSPSPSATPAPTTHHEAREIVVTERFNCSAEFVYETLLDPGRMGAVTGGASIEGKVGGQFSMFNGAVTGSVVELTRPTKIVWRWRFSTWPLGTLSTVCIDLTDGPNGLTLQLRHTGVPKDDVERTEAGWRDNIFERLRNTFGLGGLSSSSPSPSL